MLRAEFPSQTSNAGTDGVPRPSAGATAGSASFSSLFREIRSEVMDFIEHGSEDHGRAAFTLSAEGRFHQARLHPVTQAAAFTPDVEEGQRQHPFLASIAPYAREAGEHLGVSADIIAAHAALESGWGRRPLRRADGSDSHNLFGVKAGRGWRGDVIDARTTEYEGGVALAKTERFRSFPDPGAAFRDFVRLLQDNPRYQGALNTGNDVRAYAQGLVRGGYATDPAYADKLARVAARIRAQE